MLATVRPKLTRGRPLAHLSVVVAPWAVTRHFWLLDRRRPVTSGCWIGADPSVLAAQSAVTRQFLSAGPDGQGAHWSTGRSWVVLVARIGRYGAE
jgi:hypothetical protein